MVGMDWSRLLPESSEPGEIILRASGKAAIYRRTPKSAPRAHRCALGVPHDGGTPAKSLLVAAAIRAAGFVADRFAVGAQTMAGVGAPKDPASEAFFSRFPGIVEHLLGTQARAEAGLKFVPGFGGHFVSLLSGLIITPALKFL
jgi:hypothetical protein